ncbi:hypothetical protein PENTCL1PPCAC_389, partial [Pristionchus entomophagus]
MIITYFQLNYRADSFFIYIQMQLCLYSLMDWLHNNMKASSRNLNRMKTWFKQIVSAVEYIHTKNLIHRDLKPSNILSADSDYLKLCDLGISTTRTIDDDNEEEYTRTCAGTFLYMSPEQKTMNRYSLKTDVFTLGLILAEKCEVIPKTKREEIFNNYRMGLASDLIQDTATPEFIGLITQIDQRNRLSCREMLDHTFLTQD